MRREGKGCEEGGGALTKQLICRVGAANARSSWRMPATLGRCHIRQAHVHRHNGQTISHVWEVRQPLMGNSSGVSSLARAASWLPRLASHVADIHKQCSERGWPADKADPYKAAASAHRPSCQEQIHPITTYGIHQLLVAHSLACGESSSCRRRRVVVIVITSLALLAEAKRSP